MNTTIPFSSVLDKKYGPKGSEKRDNYDSASLAFRLGIILKEARMAANLTQDELAVRSGTKKSYISRIERGMSDIQLSTFQRIVETGLGRPLVIAIG